MKENHSLEYLFKQTCYTVKEMSTSGQVPYARTLYDLKLIASLTPGKTLSTSTMTIIDHNSWASSFWRTYHNAWASTTRSYPREDRKDALRFIKDVFTGALTVLKEIHSIEIIEHLEAAMKGCAHLKETYKGDYYTISEIDTLVNNTTASLTKFKTSADLQTIDAFIEDIVQTSIAQGITGTQEITSIVNDIVDNVADTVVQKISPTDNSQTELSADQYSSPDIQEVVSTSNRADSPSSIKGTVCSPVTGDAPKSHLDVCAEPYIPLNKPSEITEIVTEISVDTAKNVINESNRISACIEKGIDDSSVSKSQDEETTVTGKSIASPPLTPVFPIEISDRDIGFIKNIQTSSVCAIHLDELPMAPRAEWNRWDQEWSTWECERGTNFLSELICCPTPETGNTEKNIPPIIELARAFKQWIDNISEA